MDGRSRHHHGDVRGRCTRRALHRVGDAAMTAIRAANGRMERYIPDPAAPHVVLQEDGRPAIKFARAIDAVHCAVECDADCIIDGLRINHAERAE